MDVLWFWRTTHVTTANDASINNWGLDLSINSTVSGGWITIIALIFFGTSFTVVALTILTTFSRICLRGAFQRRIFLRRFLFWWFTGSLGGRCLTWRFWRWWWLWWLRGGGGGGRGGSWWGRRWTWWLSGGRGARCTLLPSIWFSHYHTLGTFRIVSFSSSIDDFDGFSNRIWIWRRIFFRLFRWGCFFSLSLILWIRLSCFSDCLLCLGLILWCKLFQIFIIHGLHLFNLRILCF